MIKAKNETYLHGETSRYQKRYSLNQSTKIDRINDSEKIVEDDKETTELEELSMNIEEEGVNLPVNPQRLTSNFPYEEEKEMTPEEQRQFENHEHLGMYMRQKQDLSWEELKFSDKIKLINLYSPLALFGNIC